MRVERRRRPVLPKRRANSKGEEPVAEAKPFDVPKRLVWDAYKRVKANRGAAGVDRQSLADFEKDLKGNLYKVWNRMASGSYFPPAVRLVEIPKGEGGTRPLGIPTVGDRIAQTVVKIVLEPVLEPHFHEDSYGYRPGKSAHDALGIARKRSWRADWVIDLDIKGFFDNLRHDLVLKAVAHHTDNPWIRLYISRWLCAPVEKQDGSHVERTRGTPQGGVISPLLANLFMHYAFDIWMQRTCPRVRFERYADDAIVHCVSEAQARYVLAAIRTRLADCGLELHPVKTKIVYCKDDDRRGEYEQVQFDFLGYTFQPRRARNRHGKYFVSFLPAVSPKAAKAVRKCIREWRMASTRNNQSLEDLAQLVNPVVRGWTNYYGRFYRSKWMQVLRHLDRALVAWACWKYRRLRRRERAATHWLGRIARRDPNLFAHWQLGVRPAAGAGGAG